MAKFLKIGIFQFAPVFGEKLKNIRKFERALKLSKSKPDLIVLPELFNTGYQFISKSEVFSLSEKIPDGETSCALIDIAKKQKMHIVAGIAERVGAKIYNSAVLFGPKGHIYTYRKLHLFKDEKLYFAPGDTALRVHNIGGAKVGIIVCFDWAFPEAARTLALAGADIIAHPVNFILPYGPNAMITRSVENRVFTATANRFGAEKRGNKQELRFIGQSQIISPTGEMLIKFSAREQGVRAVKINLDLARDKQITPRNHLFKDRRKEFYRL